MRLIAFSIAAAVTLAACSEQAPARDPNKAPAPALPEPRPAATPDRTASVPADECGAAERQDWVGRARSDLPAAPAGALWRVFETGQPVTQDLRENRLNIEIDPDSQTVVRLTCG